MKVLRDETLRTFALELVEAVRNIGTIHWAVREKMLAGMRNAVRRVLRKHGYPPNMQEKAMQTELEQVELLSEEWTNNWTFIRRTETAVDQHRTRLVSHPDCSSLIAGVNHRLSDSYVVFFETPLHEDAQTNN